jgi:hypothetical protein
VDWGRQPGRQVFFRLALGGILAGSYHSTFRQPCGSNLCKIFPRPQASSHCKKKMSQTQIAMLTAMAAMLAACKSQNSQSSLID